MRQYFTASSKVYSPEKHFDTFVGMYKDGIFGLGTFSSVYPDSPSAQNFDKRWLTAFIVKNDVKLVCHAMNADFCRSCADLSGGEPRPSASAEGSAVREETLTLFLFAVKYLERYLKAGIEAKKLQPDSVSCVSKLADIEYKELDKILFSILENCIVNGEYLWICNWLSHNPEKYFSRDYIKKFEALHKKTKKAIIAEIADNLRKHYGEEHGN